MKGLEYGTYCLLNGGIIAPADAIAAVHNTATATTIIIVTIVPNICFRLNRRLLYSILSLY